MAAILCETPTKVSYSARKPPSTLSQIFLRRAAKVWLAIAIVGQLAFATYVIGFYGSSELMGDPARWNKVMPHGFVEGDTALNAVLGLHLLFAAIILVGGTLQLLPAIRRHVPTFHRRTGRLYIFAAVVMSGGGLTMVWVRGSIGDTAQHVLISVNALLILSFAAMALKNARARRFDAHRRWALRLFLAVSGVWFFRIGLMFWIVVNGGPVGFNDDTFIGPALIVLGAIAYLAPALVLQAYFYASERAGRIGQWTMTAALMMVIVASLVGVVAAALLMWWPRLTA